MDDIKWQRSIAKNLQDTMRQATDIVDGISYKVDRFCDKTFDEPYDSDYFDNEDMIESLDVTLYGLRNVYNRLEVSWLMLRDYIDFDEACRRLGINFTRDSL